MSRLTLYSTHCPKCNVLEAKLSQSGIEFNICEDMDVMQEKGFVQAPMLGILDESGNEEVLDFMQAIKWIAEQ